MQDRKELKIYEDINELFRLIVEKKDSQELKHFLQFQKKNKHQSPFNNALIYAQNPRCVYYMTSDQWLKRHGCRVREDARPMIILFPFGPIKFVYDVSQVEGNKDIVENDFLNWWQEDKNNIITADIIEKTIRVCEKKYQIHLEHKDPKDYLEHHSLSTGGYVSSKKDLSDRPHIVLHPRYDDISMDFIIEKYGVLVHEIGHVLLGHLGQQRYFINSKTGQSKELCPERRHLERNVEELEAELVAWLVFNRFGIHKKSEEYMATWFLNKENMEKMDFALCLRTANKIFEMKD